LRADVSSTTGHPHALTHLRAVGERRIWQSLPVADFHADASADCHSHVHAEPHRNGAGRAHTDAHSDAYANRDSQRIADADAHAHAHAEPNPDEDADIQGTAPGLKAQITSAEDPRLLGRWRSRQR